MSVLFTRKGCTVLAVAGVAVALLVPCAPAAVPWVAHGARAASGHTQGYLGIGFHDLSDDQMAALHLHGVRAVEVIMVDHDGPAGKAGLRAHDVVVSMNGQTLNGADALRHRIHDAGPGAQITLAILRAGQSITLTAQLSDRSEVARDALQRLLEPDPTDSSAGEPGALDDGAEDTGTAAATPVRGQSFLGAVLHSPFTGITVEPLSTQLAGFFGAPEGAGLLVRMVVPGSPAARCGLRAGDVVLHADGTLLHTEAQWAKRVHASKGRPMSLGVLRDKRETSMTLLPEMKRRSALEWPRPWGAWGSMDQMLMGSRLAGFDGPGRF